MREVQQLSNLGGRRLTAQRRRAANPRRRAANPRPRAANPRRAAAAVEMAVVLPIVVLMFFGMVEASNLVFLKSAVTHASREATRFSITPGATISAITNKAIDELGRAGISGGTVTVTPDPATAAPRAMISVQVSISHAANRWTPGLAIAALANVNATVTMCKE